MQDLVVVKRALISVSDRTGLAEFATALVNEFQVNLISTGGTAKFLRDAGLSVKDVSAVTGFPEMMDGRVKTLHPKIHGGLLALRDDPAHAASMKSHDITPIDLVCVNLYPFEQTIAKPDVTFDEAIENIDIGGPSMVRSAAKNHAYVAVVTDVRQYQKILGDLRKHAGSTCANHRRKLAQAAFAKTATYDATIAGYLDEQLEVERSPLSGEEHSFRTELRTHARRQAIAIIGTEAFVFRVTKSNVGFKKESVAHIRPDNSDAATKAEALRAANEIVDACLRDEKDGIIRIADSDLIHPQFAFITLLRAAGEVCAATLVISRADNESAAEVLLDKMRVEPFHALPPQSDAPEEPTLLPEVLTLVLNKRRTLRYGENPHQAAALYTESAVFAGGGSEASVARTTQLHGKELSYINLLDADAALSVAKEFCGPAACVVKHATPCGVATAAYLTDAFLGAYAGDPVAAFGGIVAFNRPIDLVTARTIVEGQKFLEVIVAPSFDDDALELLKARWKNTRLLALDAANSVNGGVPRASDAHDFTMHKIVGGYLIQTRDQIGLNPAVWKIITKRRPSEAEMKDLGVAWLACKHVKSNAIVIAKDSAAVGIGGGQVDRVNAARIAVMKAGERARGAVAASDAFFPFPDGPELLLDAGVTAIIHPGGSVRDNETIALADARGAAVVLTGQRHFRH